MKCPYCEQKSRVTNSRNTANGMRVWRRRQCKSCAKAWSTSENITPETSHIIVNDTTDETHPEPLQRDRILLMVHDSLQHRKAALNEAGALTDTIIARVLRLNRDTVELTVLNDIINQTLQRFDPLAAKIFTAKYT